MKTVLYVAGSRTANWFYNCVDAAIWLDRRNCDSCEQRETTIFHLPLSVPRVLVSRVRQGIPKTKLNRSVFKEFRAYGRVVIDVGNHRITVVDVLGGWFETMQVWLWALVRASRVWVSCFRDGHFDSLGFLKVDVAGVCVGDLVASTALRHSPSMAGSLRPRPALFTRLVTAIWIHANTSRLQVDASRKNYVFAAEPTYLDSVAKRVLHALGANILEPTCLSDRYEIFSDQPQNRHPWIAKASRHPIKNPSRIEQYLDGRLNNPAAHLWYMTDGANENSEEVVRKADGAHVTLAQDEISAVLFLNSFDDGQYFFGLDGFSDIYAWVEFTLEHCLANPHLNQILVKQHPGLAHHRFKANRAAVERLQGQYMDTARVSFLDPRCSLVSLARAGRWFGITHHGSVAEEVVFLGQPMLGSSRAPWGQNYRFLKVWDTIDQYAQFLADLGLDTWRPPTGEERELLYRFVEEYRFKTLPVEELDPWIKFARVCGDTDMKPNNDNARRYNRVLAQLHQSAPEFGRFMDAMQG